MSDCRLLLILIYSVHKLILLILKLLGGLNSFIVIILQGMEELPIFYNLPGKETKSVIAGFAQDSTVHYSSFSNLFWIILFLCNALTCKDRICRGKKFPTWLHINSRLESF